jgi:hypothetical protein
VFDLDREANAWIESVHSGRCRNAASAAELRDHLDCEIDRARAGGLSDEQAFAAAVARLGPADTLATELGKDRSLLAAGCAVAARLEGRDASDRFKGPLLAHALLWAGVVVATALLSPRSEGTKPIEFLILGILVPCWLASEQILRSVLRRSRAGGAR